MSQSATDTTLAERVVELRDQGVPWKELSLRLRLSPNGKPAAKKAKRLYEQVRGPGSSATQRPGKAPKDAGAPKATRKASGRRTRAQGASRAPLTATPDPAYLDYTEPELVAMFTGHTIHAIYTAYGVGTQELRTYRVQLVKGFGMSPRSGARYVEFIDGDSKFRAITLSSIVKVTR